MLRARRAAASAPAPDALRRLNPALYKGSDSSRGVKPAVYDAVGKATIAAALAVAAAHTPAAQTDVSMLVERAGTYVERFQQSFGSVVAEERYEQKLRRIPSPTNTAVQQPAAAGR